MVLHQIRGDEIDLWLRLQSSNLSVNVRLQSCSLSVNVRLSIEIFQSFLKSFLVTELNPIVLKMSSNGKFRSRLKMRLRRGRWGTVGRQLRSYEVMMVRMILGDLREY